MENIQNIWLLLDSRKAGGIESHVLQLAIGLHNHKTNVTVVFLSDYGEHPLRNALHKHGIPTIDLNGSVLSLWKEMRRTRPNIIHTHGYKAGIIGRLLGKICHIPLASTYHAGEKTTGKLWFYCSLDKLSACLADRIFAVSPQIASSLPNNTQIVDNFINVNDFNDNFHTLKGHQIAFVGRLSKEKGPDIYLKLAKYFPEINFHIYGEGPMEMALKKISLSNVYFHGQQSDMASIWPKIGLLVMPSRYEGLPMAALEAMAQGIPVLASHVGALDQLIDNGENGWLVKSANIKDLVKYIKRWSHLGDEKKRHLKQACRRKILQRFSSDVIIPKLIKHYTQITIQKNKDRHMKCI